MPSRFRRPLPKNRSTDNLSILSRGEPPLLSELSTDISSELCTPSERVGSNEVLVYYDSAWSTDEVCLPPVRERRGEHYQPNVARRPRAVSDSLGVGLTDTGAPSRKRPLVKAVGKAKGLVKIVARRSIRRLRKKHEAAGDLDDFECALSTSSSAPEGWSQTGISIVVTAACDADTRDGPVLNTRPSEGRFSITSAECHALPFLSPARPQNSISVVDSGPSSPHIAEMDALKIMTVFQYGNQTEEDLTNPSDAKATNNANAWKSALNGPFLANALHIVLFVPWCVAVGGAILLVPSAAGTLAFAGGFSNHGPPPQGLRRVAYWAANAYEHVFVFLACTAALLYQDRDPMRRAWMVVLFIMRMVWVWAGYRPAPRLHKRVGENDMESLWLVWKGKSVMEAVTHGQPAEGEHKYSGNGSCGNVCQCHGVCAARCPKFQRMLRNFGK